METRKFRSLLRRTVLLPFVVVMSLAGALFWEARNLNSSLLWVDHTDQVIASSSRLYRLLIDMETGVRGYLLTGDDVFLQPYYEGERAINPEYQSLRALIADNPTEQARLEHIRDGYMGWRRYAEQMIQSRRTAAAFGDDQANLLGKREMDALRSQLAAFQAVEQQLRDERTRTAQRIWGLISLTCLILFLGIGILIAFFTRMQIRILARDFQRSLDKATALLDLSYDAILVRNEKDLIGYWNQGAIEAYGFSREEAVGSSHELLRTEFPQPLSTIFDTLRRDGRWTGELVHTRKDGKRITVSSRWAAERDRHGNIQAILETNSDITERKHAEDALRASEEQFRTLANAIPQLCWMANADGWIFWYNDRWYQYTGTTPEQMEGWGWQSVQDPETLPKVLEQWKGSIASGQPLNMVFPLKGADGVFRPFLTRVVPIEDSNGNVVRWFGTNTDISEQKRTEEELEKRVNLRTAELQALNKELEAFSYSVSHDLRAPLRTLDGFSQALLSSAANLDEKSCHYIDRIRFGAQRMRSLIDGLLLLSRTTRAELQMKRVNLSELAHLVIQDLRREEPGRQVEVQIQPELRTIGDSRLLQAALQNLLGNAWKFTAKREQAAIEFGRLGNGAAAVFFIRDNGAGFDMEYADKLFTPFQRLHAESDFQGTGIGLATVQRIVQRHHGHIWAESAPGQGATFYFELGAK